MAALTEKEKQEVQGCCTQGFAGPLLLRDGPNGHALFVYQGACISMRVCYFR